MYKISINYKQLNVMKIRVIFFIFLVQILFPVIGNAQGYNRFGGNTNVTREVQSVPTPAPVNNEISEWNLPPLHTLIDAALENSPLVQMANTHILLGQYELKSVKREWLKYITLVGDARYGSMFNYARLAGIGVDATSSDNINKTYGAGLSVYMPISEIFDKRRPKKEANLKIEQAEIQKEETIINLTQIVINAYYEVLSAQKTLAIYNEISLSANMLHEQARMDFNTGRMSLTDFTQVAESYLTAQNRVELQRYSLMRAVRILEVIVGIELIK